MRIGIGARVVGGVALVVAATVAVTTWLHLRAEEATRVAQLQGTARQLSETIKRSTQRDMMDNHRERLQEQIETIGRQEGIEAVRIVNEEGRVAFSSDPAEVGSNVQLEPATFSSPARIFRSRGRRVLGVANPIANAPSCSTAACHAHPAGRTVLGVLDVGVSLADFDGAAQAARRRAMVLAFAATLISGVVLWWLAERFVVRPVETLAEATRQMAEGQVDVTVPAKGDDEIGELARAFNDMTRKLGDAQRQLTQADKLAAVGRLGAGIAHEINNPLTAVLTYASFWQKRVADNAPLAQDLETIVRETKRCREIVKRLLDFARPAAPVRVPGDVNDVARRAAAVVTHVFDLARVRFELALDEGLPPAAIDSNQIQQVLVNLLLNAADAVSADGTGVVRLVTRRGTGGGLEVDVQDNGRGILPEERAHLFEPFFTTKGTHGTGLGLSVSWGIVQAHGGSIAVASDVGQGATFTVSLPLTSGAAA
jgi:two-component system NtrC family sensor kinase